MPSVREETNPTLCLFKDTRWSSSPACFSRDVSRPTSFQKYSCNRGLFVNWWFRHLHCTADGRCQETQCGASVRRSPAVELRENRATQPPIFSENKLQCEQREHPGDDREQRVPADPCNQNSK